MKSGKNLRADYLKIIWPKGEYTPGKEVLLAPEEFDANVFPAKPWGGWSKLRIAKGFSKPNLRTWAEQSHETAWVRERGMRRIKSGGQAQDS